MGKCFAITRLLTRDIQLEHANNAATLLWRPAVFAQPVSSPPISNWCVVVTFSFVGWRCAWWHAASMEPGNGAVVQCLQASFYCNCQLLRLRIKQASAVMVYPRFTCPWPIVGWGDIWTCLSIQSGSQLYCPVSGSRGALDALEEGTEWRTAHYNSNLSKFKQIWFFLHTFYKLRRLKYWRSTRIYQFLNSSNFYNVAAD